MDSLPNERQYGHMKHLKKRSIINILRNPIYMPDDGIIGEQAIFDMFLRRKRSVILGVSKVAGETRQEAARFISALYRLRVNFFAREGNWEYAHITLEDYDSWAGNIEKAGKFRYSYDILEVSEEEIAEMRRVLDVIRQSEPKQKQDTIEFPEYIKQQYAIAAWGGPLTIKRLRTRYRILREVFE